MLNKSNSNKFNQLKLILVLPALAVFLWSFNTKEVIEYRTTTESNDTTFNTSETNNAPLRFSAESTDLELNQLEKHLNQQSSEYEVKISHRKRNTIGKLLAFRFQTKFSGEPRFSTRFDRKNDKPFTSIYEIDPITQTTLVVKETGAGNSQIEISRDNMKIIAQQLAIPTNKTSSEAATQKETQLLLGDNPLYIINGKAYRKSELPTNNKLYLNGVVKVLDSETGKARYGTKGEDGVLILEGDSKVLKSVEKSELPNQHSVKNVQRKIESASNYATKEIRLKITKNTTKAELEKMKAELKRDHNIDFNYSDIVYNANNEIMAISVSYSGKGMNGNYRIEEDNGEGIEDFYFYMDTEDGTSGFGSTNLERRHELREHRLAEREALRGQARKVRRHIREDRMEERREELEHRREEMEEVREEIEIERENMREAVAEIREEQRELIEKEREMVRNHTAMAVSHAKGSLKRVTIYDYTTDSELEAIKEKMESQGMSFKYSRVRRNAQGKITRIKIDSKTNNGSQQSISSNAKDGDTIEPIVLDL